MRADLLDFAAPELLTKLCRGALLAQVSAVSALVVIGSLVVLTLAAISFAAAGASPDWYPYVIVPLATGGPLVCGATGFAGWWMLTAPDPGIGGRRREARIRRVLRITVGAAGVCWLLVCVPVIAKELMNLPPSVYIPLQLALAIALPVSLLAMVFTTGPFLNYLARRAEDDRMPEWAAFQTKLATAAATAVGLFTLMVVGQAYELMLIGFLATIGTTIALIGYHAWVMGRTRLLLMMVRDGVPRPVSRRAKW
jgi:hypothetical protein